MMRFHYLCALLALISCASARTTLRQQQPAVSTHISSLTDKDARQKASTHPAFANAGRQAGVEIWRIEDFEPVPVPQKDFGKFYKGDSYVILKTTSDKRNNLSWDIHYWIGSESSQDESGAAAILSVGLDDKFGGAAVQHRETLGHESPQFLGYFQPAIRYLDGGHASGFNHVTTNPGAEKRLFQVKGKRNIRVRQVDPLISSMNKGDCFILDVNQDILVYVGERAKNVEKLKAISVANQIRDQDHNGRGRVEIIDQYSSETDVQRFFTALGSGSRNIVPEESAGGDDQTFESSEEQAVTLSEISDSSGSLKITALPKPYRQEQLRPQECYILDTVSGSIYVWVGKQATDREKSEAMSKAQQYLSAKNYPSWVHVTRIPQGTESAAFKQYFTTWRDVGMTHSRIVRSLSDDDDLATSGGEVSYRRACIMAKTGSTDEFTPDHGEGTFIVFRIEDMDLEKAYDSSSYGTEPGKRFGEMFQGDSYLIQYEFNVEEGHGYIVYYWLGKDSTTDEQATAAINALHIDNGLDCKATVVRVVQGEEPKHFLKIFNGRIITLLGGKGSGFRNSKQQDSYDADGTRLFKIHGSIAGEDLSVEQVPERQDTLSSDHVFVLQTPEKIYIRCGKDSSDAEREDAVNFVQQYLGESKKIAVVREGAEPEDFWSTLVTDPRQMHAGSQWRDHIAQITGVTPCLLEVIVNSDCSFIFKKLSEFKQTDLSEDEVHLLDAGDEIFLWLGKEVSDQTVKLASRIATVYNDKRSTKVTVIKQGLEPNTFTHMFDDWDPQMWLKQVSYEEEKEAALEDNEI